MDAVVTPAKQMTERDWFLLRLKGAGTTKPVESTK